jgi:uncharacterized protein YndB with AHSA1/START domain
MTTVAKTSQIFVHTPLESAFRYVSDLSRHPEWNSGLRIEAVKPGSIVVGKEYISHGEVAVQKDRPNTVRISLYEPPHKFGFVAHDPDFGEASHVFSFSAQNGGVLITRTMTLTLNPIVAFLFNNFVYPLIGGPSMKKSMAALKVKLEEDVAAASRV